MQVKKKPSLWGAPTKNKPKKKTNKKQQTKKKKNPGGTKSRLWGQGGLEVHRLGQFRSREGTGGGRRSAEKKEKGVTLKKTWGKHN